MIANLLLQCLPPEELTRLLPLGEQIAVPAGSLLLPPHEPPPALLFPLSGMLCLVTRLEAHAPLQLGMVGREGLVESAWLLGPALASMGVQVQQAGQAWCLPASAQRLAARASPSLEGLQDRYQLRQRQALATRAACLHFHTLQQRLALWLLMAQDRLQGEGFHVTQIELGQLLGVRRAGVSMAIGQLQSAGLLQHRRAWLRIDDRAGLQALACVCYRQERVDLLPVPSAHGSAAA
ncbi:Crp/Fnr family transcriptional regulator [Roseateles sp.]|jgi:CRP-like cAMP-binding protein|uniref:Crp/Fnr family transcriptional regulator n=1 Tax=Roseateles sp. TaxID=1971397 RepID=UPI00391BC22D